MQSWWRPQCGQYGPNNLLYASILINCFLIYAVLRYTPTAFRILPYLLHSSFIPFILALLCIILSSGSPPETLCSLSCYPLPQSTWAMLSNSDLFDPFSLPLLSLPSTLVHSSPSILLYSILYAILISILSPQLSLSLFSSLYSPLSTPLITAHPISYTLLFILIVLQVYACLHSELPDEVGL